MKGTRISEDWLIPEDWVLWARKERPDLNIVELVQEFKDYWVSAANLGKKVAWKISWLKTWRNWVRRQGAPDGRPLSQQPRKERLPDRSEWERKKHAVRKQGRMDEVRRALK